MGTFETVRQASWITLPEDNQCIVVNVTTTQQVINLANVLSYNLCAARAYVHIQPDGSNVFILASNNATTANALNVTATTGATACGPKMVDGNIYPFKVNANNMYLGAKAVANCQLRIIVSSPPRRN
jgi:hypothetical protein